jgi:hypothetical protein
LFIIFRGTGSVPFIMCHRCANNDDDARVGSDKNLSPMLNIVVAIVVRLVLRPGPDQYSSGPQRNDAHHFSYHTYVDTALAYELKILSILFQL